MARSRNTADTQTASGGPVSPNIAGKNGWINGGMDVWQRGTTSASITTSTVYTSDRWVALSGASTGTVVSRQSTSDTTNLPFIQYCARVQRSSGQTGTSLVQFAQSMESVNSVRYAGQSVTLSFYARAGANYSSASNALNVLMLTGTGTDQQVLVGYTGSVSAINSFATLTTTWQRFTFTATLATNTNEIGVDFYYTPVGTAGANDYFEITGVQLELGTTATPFSRAGGTIQGELAACQRYYYGWDSTNNYAPAGLGQCTSTTQAQVFINFPVTMRVTPSFQSSVGTIASLALRTSNGGQNAVTAISSDSQQTSGVLMLVTVASGLSTGNATSLGRRDAQSNAQLHWSAEL
jgi:hypothetical protein